MIARRVARDRRAQAVTVAALALAGTSAFLMPARAAIIGTQSQGDLRITGLDATSTLFAVRGMVPGEQASGNVTLGSDGLLPGTLSLSVSALEDRRGLHGGRLSDALELTVLRDGMEMYRDTLARLSQSGVELGRLSPGTPATFTIRVLFRDTGAPSGPTSGDNALQSAASRFTLRWALGEPTPLRATAASSSQTAAPAPAAAGRRACLSRRRFTIRVKRSRTRIPHTAVVRVGAKRVKVLRGRRLRAVIDLRGRPASTITVRITGRTNTGRRYTEVRRYRTCVPTSRSSRPLPKRSTTSRGR